MASILFQDRPYLFLGSRLKRLADQMQAEAASVTRDAGIPAQPGYAPILAVLDDQAACSIGQLVDAVGSSQPAITKLVARMAAAGLVDVAAADRDRRQRLVSLSAAGRRAMALCRRTVWPAVEHAVRALADDNDGSFLEQLARIEDRLATRSLSSRARDAVPNLAAATSADVPAIVSLMNRAYRGRGADAGWNSEAAYIDGDRTSEDQLRQDLAGAAHATLLLWRHPDRTLLGCVWMQPEPDDVWYLGSLTIAPDRQNGGLGRRLLAAAEDWARANGARAIRMTVVNLRDTLIAWYARRGYVPTGETEPFPYDDDRFGTPRRDDLCFVVLCKSLPDPDRAYAVAAPTGSAAGGAAA